MLNIPDLSIFVSKLRWFEKIEASILFRLIVLWKLFSAWRLEKLQNMQNYYDANYLVVAIPQFSSS